MEMGVARDPKLWSARGLIDEQYHGIVVAAHKKYIEAGARMITTNNYAVQPVYYRNAFPSDWEMRIARDSELAARLAVEARNTATTSHPVQVLGSLPPLCESHRPDLCEDFIRDEGEEFVKKTYRCIAQALLRGGPVDAFVAETMNNWDEARLAIEAVKDLGCPIWVCFQGSFRDRALVNKPEELGLEYARKVLDMKTKGYPIAGFGMNCAPPEDTYAGLEVLEHAGMMENFKKAGMHFMVYANCNEQTHVSGGYRVERSFVTKVKSREDLFGDMCGAYTNWCRRFAALGVTHLGGCCGSTPDHISSLQHEAELQQEEKEDNSSEGLSD